MRELPPIAKLSERLQIEIELAVGLFPRRHRYQVGAKLREKAADVRSFIDRAWRDPDRRAHWTQELAWSVDELRHTMQVAKGVHAFRSFAQFEALIRLAEDLGRQVGGWQKRHHPKGQNPPHSRPERAQTLSTRDASMGANR